jgi:hypothetical protein
MNKGNLIQLNNLDKKRLIQLTEVPRTEGINHRCYTLRVQLQNRVRRGNGLSYCNREGT